MQATCGTLLTRARSSTVSVWWWWFSFFGGGRGGRSALRVHQRRWLPAVRPRGTTGWLAYAGTGLNYGAVLDTAADVARAMAHLHSLNVIHGDLKVRG